MDEIRALTYLPRATGTRSSRHKENWIHNYIRNQVITSCIGSSFGQKLKSSKKLWAPVFMENIGLPKRDKQLALTFLPSLPSRLIQTWNHFLVCLSNFILLPLIFYSKPTKPLTLKTPSFSLWLKPLNMYLKKVQGIFGPKGVLSNKIARVVKKGCLKKRNSMSWREKMSEQLNLSLHQQRCRSIWPPKKIRANNKEIPSIKDLFNKKGNLSMGNDCRSKRPKPRRNKKWRQDFYRSNFLILDSCHYHYLYNIHGIKHLTLTFSLPTMCNQAND